MSEAFSLDIVQHPETRLYHSWSTAPQENLQLLLLFDKVYLSKKTSGALEELHTITEPDILQKIAHQHKLPAEDLEYLSQKFSQSTEINEASTVATQTVSPSNTSQGALAIYGGQSSIGIETSQPSAPIIEQEPAGQQPPPLVEQTYPLVEQALEIAQEQQQDLLHEAERLQLDIRQQQTQLLQHLRQVPALEEELELLNEKLEDWQQQMESQHHHQETLVHHTQQELTDIQSRLQNMLSQGMALQNHLQSRRLPADHQLQHKLNYLGEMVDHVVAQRHSVHYILQQKSYQQLEAARIHILKERYEKIAHSREKLSQHIQQLEAVNREIMEQDPLAVPEPVPVMVLHELQRLQFEQDVLEADPGLKNHIKEECP